MHAPRLLGVGLVTTTLALAPVVLEAPTRGVTPVASLPSVASTLTVALPPSAVPTSVFPFDTGMQCTTTNIDYWNLDVRPGYWFGLGRSVSLEEALSPLAAPTFVASGENTSVTFSTKGWTWSDGAGGTETMSAQDIAFFLNLDKAQSQQGSNAACGDVPGDGIPDQIVSASYPQGLAGAEVTIEFAGHPDHQWIEDNELAQIVPLATAWDTTGSGAAGCSTEPFSAVQTSATGGEVNGPCQRVFAYLAGLSIDNPLWDWSDGPYRQESAQYAHGAPDGRDVQVANSLYSGPVKAHAVTSIAYVPFNSTSAEIAALEAGKVDLGYANLNDTSRSRGPGDAGHNLLARLENYRAIGSTLYGVFFWDFNFDNAHSTYQTTGPLPIWAKLINQQYFRAALAESIDQPSLISHIDNGYGVQTHSAIPGLPPSPYGKGVVDPYPYSPTKGKALMRAHGWDTSVFPDRCGATNCGSVQFPIPRGTTAVVQLTVPGGDPNLATSVHDEVASIRKASGIDLRAVFPYDPIVQPLCPVGAFPWEICAFGNWIYDPDFYPSGEALFSPGTISNPGGYDSTEMVQLIKATATGGSLGLTKRDPTYDTSYAQWSATDVPMLWQPTPASYVEQLRSIAAAQPPNPLGDFNPEYITSI